MTPATVNLISRLHSRLSSWLRATLERSRTENEMDSELRFHIAAYAEDLIRAGIPCREALRRARIEFGGVERAKEECREARGVHFLEILLADLRYARRTLRKSPGFTLAAILTLALGIGANTAIFTVVHAVLLRPLPYLHPQQLVTWRGTESQLDVDDIRSQSTSFFSAGGAINPEVLTYTGASEPVAVYAGYVDAGLLEVFGVPPALGRTFSPDEDRSGGPRAVVLTHRFWRQYLAADPKVLGTTIPLDGNSYRIIGVMPATFVLPQQNLDVFVSLRVVYPEAAAYRGVHFMNSYWRLRPRVTLPGAAAGMAAIDARLASAYPAEDKNRRTILVPLEQSVTGDVRPALFVLSAAVCVVLLIAAANFACLLMARSIARRREIVIRAALGGSRSRLVRQSLTESLLLAALGGTVALPLAQIAIHLLSAAKPAALTHVGEISMNPTVMAFGLALALLTGLLFGLPPASFSSRANVTDALKEEGRTSSAGPSANNFRRTLVAVEISLALVLLIGTGLLIKSFARLRSVNPGFDPANVIAVNVALPAARYAEIPKQSQFRRHLLDGLNSLPGVQAAMVGDAPLNGGEVTHSLAFESRPPVAEGDLPEVDTFCVMGDYFRVMRIALRSGRTFTPTDAEGHPLVAVVNEALARQYFVDHDPIGQRIRWGRETGPPRWMTIIGVVADVKQYSLADPADPAVFTPFAQSNEAWRRWMSVVVRLPNSASAARIAEIKRQVWDLDSQIPLNRIVSTDELLGLSLAERQFNMSLLAVFASLAMLLVAVGVYGVVSYGVTQRTHEIGIRIAIGARRLDVLKIVMGQGARIAAIGLPAGIVAALALTRLMATLLFGVTPADPSTFAAVVLLMLAVVLLACFVPARRAMRVDPITALRHE
jgi:putative ABC transport system permease protein